MRAVRHIGLETAAWRLFVAGVCVHFCFSAHALITLGYPYEAPLSGPFPFKIHPGTYLLAMALLCALASRGHPLRSAFRAVRQLPLIGVHLGVMVLCLAWVLYRHGPSGAAFIVDTHWVPALAALTLLHMDDRRRARLLPLLATFVLVNAGLGITEYALGARLVPLHMPGQESGFAEEGHFRSSGLLGHPLTNAKLMAALLPIALTLTWRGLWRWAAVATVAMGLLAFGSRAALGIVLVVYGSWLLGALGLMVVRGRFSYLQLTGGGVFALLGVAALVGVVIATGIGDRIFGSLYLDNSASVRLKVWSAYSYLTSEQLWLGISARDIDLVALRLGLDPKYEAIENGWIYLSMQLGLIVFGLWVIGFGCLLTWLVRVGTPLTAAGVLVYVAVSSTNNAFASKSITQGLLVTYVVAAGAQRREERRRIQAATAHGRRSGMPPALHVPGPDRRPVAAAWRGLSPGLLPHVPARAPQS